MLLLGIDIGTSSVKVSVVDAATQQCITSAQYPETEAEIISLQNGWAEQNPDTWWEYLQHALMEANVSGKYKPKDIAAIGIAYQMHGLEAGLNRRFGKNIMTQLKYGFYRSDDASNAGANNYTAHALIASLTLRLP